MGNHISKITAKFIASLKTLCENRIDANYCPLWCCVWIWTWFVYEEIIRSLFQTWRHLRQEAIVWVTSKNVVIQADVHLLEKWCNRRNRSPAVDQIYATTTTDFNDNAIQSAIKICGMQCNTYLYRRLFYHVFRATHRMKPKRITTLRDLQDTKQELDDINVFEDMNILQCKN